MKPKPTIAIPPQGCESYLTAGKEYQIVEWKDESHFIFKCDIDDDLVYTRVNGSAHLNFKDWILR